MIPLRDLSWKPILFISIHGMGPTTGLPISITITTTMALIAIALVAMNLTLDPSILGIWVTPALLRKMARLATVVESGS